jgi:hypothetical protein
VAVVLSSDAERPVVEPTPVEREAVADFDKPSDITVNELDDLVISPWAAESVVVVTAADVAVDVVVSMAVEVAEAAIVDTSVFRLCPLLRSTSVVVAAAIGEEAGASEGRL